MKVAFIGFLGFAHQKRDLTEVLTKAGHVVVSKKKAEVILAPHHRDWFFPRATPWIAIWVKGCAARLTELSELANAPKELIAMSPPNSLGNGQGDVLIATIKKIQGDR